MPRKKTHEEFVQDMAIKNPNIKIIGEYKSSRDAISIQCVHCNYIWSVRADSLVNRMCPNCGDDNIRTHENFVEKMKIVNPNIEILSNYIKCDLKVQLKCKIDGHLWEAVPESLLAGFGCPKCHLNNITKSHDVFVKEMLEINPNIIIIGKYKLADIPIEVECKICKHLWETKPRGLLNHNGCPKCSGRVKKTQEEYVNEIEQLDSDISIISEYLSCHERIDVQCKKCGFIWSTSPSCLAKHHNCSNCSNITRKTHEEFVLNMEKINPNIKIIGKYLKSNVHIDVQCKVCGNIWSATPNSLQSHTGCPKCYFRNNAGINNYNWKGGISTVSKYTRDYLKEWKKRSMETSNYKCVITGRGFDVIHHKYSYDKIMEETMLKLQIPMYKEINEYTYDELHQIVGLCLDLHFKYGLGVCLCKEEHDLFHSIYGLGNNTPEQFEEFKNKRLQELQIYKK